MGRRQCRWFDMFSHLSLVAYIHILLTLSSFKLSFAFSPFLVLSYCNQRDTSTLYNHLMLRRVGNRLIHQYSRRSSRTMSISALNKDTLYPQEDMNNSHRPLVIVLAGPTAGKSALVGIL